MDFQATGGGVLAETGSSSRGYQSSVRINPAAKKMPATRHSAPRNFNTIPINVRLSANMNEITFPDRHISSALELPGSPRSISIGFLTFCCRRTNATAMLLNATAANPNYSAGCMDRSAGFSWIITKTKRNQVITKTKWRTRAARRLSLRLVNSFSGSSAEEFSLDCSQLKNCLVRE
jgi:hypothetical protein